MLLCIPPSFSLVRSSPVAIQIIKHYIACYLLLSNNKIKEFIGGPQRYTMIVLFGPLIFPVFFQATLKHKTDFSERVDAGA